MRSLKINDRGLNEQYQEDLFPDSSNKKQNDHTSFLAKTDSDPSSPYCYIKAHKMNSQPLKKNIITPENFSHYKQLAETNLKMGQPDTAMSLYRECIDSLTDVYGIDSENYDNFFIDSVKALCNHAMKSLNKNNMYSCFNILFECNEMTQPNGGEANLKYFPQLHAMVLNNLGCAYRRINKNRKAYQYLKEAIKVVFKYKVETLIGLTYINLCSVTSQMGFHAKAIYFAKNSLIYCQNDLLNLTSQKTYDPAIYKEKVHLVAVSFYNLAVEEEFQRDFDKALDWYKKAYVFIEEKLGPNEPTIKKFKLAYDNTKEKLIDKVLNQNQIGELPKFPVNKTLKKFYRPTLHSNAQGKTINNNAGWKIYTTATNKQQFPKNFLLNKTSPRSSSFYYRGK